MQDAHLRPVTLDAQESAHGGGDLDARRRPFAHGGGLDDQVMVEQLVKPPPGSRHAGPVESRGGIRIDVRPRVQPQPPEQPPLLAGEILIGQVERRRDGQVLGVHQLEPVTGGREFPCQFCRRPGGMVVQLAG